MNSYKDKERNMAEEIKREIFKLNFQSREISDSFNQSNTNHLL